jgi:hypothetical protein
MSIFRSYFLKNNTLIGNNLSNNSQNPVTEISYGTFDKQVSRFIFDVDLSNLQDKIAKGFINPNRIVKHVLHMTNTISYAPQYLGKKSYSENIDRATSFDLELFNIDEEWDEGSGYEFSYSMIEPPKYDISGNTTGQTIFVIGDYIEMQHPELTYQASNWFYRKTNQFWANSGGSYQSGVTQIIGTGQTFQKGNENIDIDITDYINQRLFTTGYTGTSAFTGASYGLGIKFADFYEDLETTFRQAVAFHAKHTNTFYEPYIETIIDDNIVDDRNYFYLDKENELYLYVNVGGVAKNITVDRVEIRDNEGVLIDTLSGDSIENVSLGIYKIKYQVDSQYDKGRLINDAVLFEDRWYVTINGRDTEHVGEFYLISPNKYYTFDNSNTINFDNYFFYFWGISEKENLRAGNVRKIKLTIKELYANQNNFLPLELEYRLFTTVGKKYEIDIIPFEFGMVNRTNSGYEFNLDTSWLIPQDYYLQIRMKNGNYYENKQTLSFTVVSDGIIKV